MPDFSGTPGNDLWIGTSANETASGGDGNDVMFGREGDDIINGDGGDDTLSGGFGNDVVNGGAGDDTITFASDSTGSELSSGDQFSGGAGFDTIAFDGTARYDFPYFDLTSFQIPSDIEGINTSYAVLLTRAQLAQFSSIYGTFYVADSGSLTFGANTYVIGTIHFGPGDDTVSMAGNLSNTSTTLDGGEGNDILIGSASLNVLIGGEGNDQLEGGAGNDVLSGDRGDDLAYGGDGDDKLYDYWGDDLLDGGNGNDIFEADFTQGFSARDTIVGGAGYDTLNISDNFLGDTFRDYSEFSITGIEQIVGRSARFTMSLSQANQFDALILGGLQLTSGGTITVGANWQITNYALSDFATTFDLSASTAFIAYSVTAGAGNDVLIGSNASGTLSGGAGNDVLRGGSSADELIGGAGVDILEGGAGNDLLRIGVNEIVSAGDQFIGGADYDTLVAGYDPYLTGAIIDLTVATISGIESLQAGRVLVTIGQLSAFASVSANDLYIADGGALPAPSAAFNAYRIYLSDFGNSITIGGAYTTVYGGGGNDMITGNDADNEMWGGGGDDTLIGGAGGDLLHGGTGSDRLEGGLGNDSYYVEDSTDLIIELADGGYDYIFSTVSYTVTASSYIEELWLVGTDNVNATGSDLNDRLIGNSGNNVLDGRGGADVMIGGNGDDTYHVDNVGDVVDEGGSTYGDQVISSISFVLPTFVENLTLTGTAAINGTGNHWDNLIVGNGADNVLDGGAGQDLLIGGLGNDTYAVDDMFDVVVENAGGGTDIVLSTSTSTSLLGPAAAVENLTLTGTGDIGASGNALANLMTGNSGHNWLQSGAGSDTLIGGAGDDFLDGGEGNDTINGGDGADILLGGAGVDVLTGGANNDIFYFGSAFAGEVDQITDFTVGDVIFLDSQLFTTLLVAGPLAASAFKAGTVATSSSHRIVYNSATGQISYDADGNGAGAAILFATVAPGTILTSASFQVGAHGPFEVESAGSYLLASGEVNLVLSGTRAVSGSGNELNNFLNGNGNSNWLDGGSGNDTLNGAAGNDTLTGGAGIDTLTGGADADTFVDTKAGLSGDTITDLAIGDKIVITDATLAGFTFNLSGSTLTYTGGSLTLTGGVTGNLVASAAAGGGVQLTIQTTVNDARNDFNGDGRSDILWRNVDGQMSNWLGTAAGGFTPNNANAAAVVPVAWQIAGTGDFNGDGRDDILWRHTDGTLSNWLATTAGGYTPNDANAAVVVPTAWHVVGTGDFNGDGRDDILWRHNDGTISNWLGTAAGGFVANDANAAAPVPTDWHVAGVGDFNGDGRDDILWRNDDGQLSNWLGTATGGFTPNNANAAAVVPTAWSVIGTGDFNGDGRDDILWRHTDGTLSNWLGTAAGGFTPNDANAAVAVPLAWSVVAVGDYNGDGRDDILWRHTDGTLSNWLGTAAGGFTPNDANAATPVPVSWEVQPESFLL